MINKLIPGLLLIVASTASNASWFPNSNDLAEQSIDIAYQLNRFSDENKLDICSGDVTVAAAYIESAGRELKREQYTKALTSLSYGQNELKEISSSRSYCSNLAAGVKPYLAKIILLKNEVENTPVPVNQ